MDKSKLTPMMKQYLDIKQQYPDTILFYRLGDFYEMFFDDALLASKILNIALTGRNAGLEKRAPMCGVPFHSADNYISKLINAGYRVAICEQLEDSTDSKLVKRGVTKIITPGSEIAGDDYNYLLHVYEDASFYYLAFSDLSTGKLKAKRLNKDMQLVFNEIKAHNIKEVVIKHDFDSSLFNELLKTYKFLVSFVEEKSDESFLNNIDSEYQEAFAYLFGYLKQINYDDLQYFMEVEYEADNYLKMDYNTQSNLEIITTLKNNDKYGSLFWLLDKTKTAMGSRLLKDNLNKPLIDKEAIIERQELVKHFLSNHMISEQILNELINTYDLARLATRIGQESIDRSDLARLVQSLDSCLNIINLLDKPLINNEADLISIKNLIESTIDLDVINEMDIIKKGYDEELDEYRLTLNNSTQWLLDYEQQQRELTKIKNLKIKYNKVYGYFIEVTNANKDLIKDEYNYIRRQTLVNAERYVNSELKEQETKILLAKENTSSLEQKLFKQFKQSLAQYTNLIQELAHEVAYLDFIMSLYQLALDSNYSCPTFNDEDKVIIKDSFHPIIKQLYQDQEFINNDIILNEDTNLALITGPNMGGKSTYMRQLTLIVIMAQIGSFVPATSANLKLFSSIYSRMGASDNISQGQSTFMVEMLEAANALTNFNNNSLIIFDELGRGTATYDGLAIAWAIVEYLAQSKKAKTLFSTHYHELTKLDETYPNIINLSASVIENEANIQFTYKIVPGSIDKSYGVHVASLAHIPPVIIKRAQQILVDLEKDTVNKDIEYVELIKESILDEKIKQLDLNNVTPMQALSLLQEYQIMVKDNE